MYEIGRPSAVENRITDIQGKNPRLDSGVGVDDAGVDWMCRQALGEDVLDLGCGLAPLAIRLAGSGINLTGVDLTSDQIHRAREHVAQLPPDTRERMSLLVGDGAALPFPDETFDSVLIDGLAGGFAITEAVLIEASRVLKIGGHLYVTSPIEGQGDSDGEEALHWRSLVKIVMRHFRIVEAEPVGSSFGMAAERIAPFGSARRGARTRVQKLEQDRWKLKNELVLTQWKLQSTRSRKWWRLGSVLGEVRRRPLAAIAVLGRAIRVLFTESQLPPRPELEPNPEDHDRTVAASGASVPTVTIPELTEPAPMPRRLVVVATLVSEAEERNLRHEWQSIDLSRSDWREALLNDGPELLFVSADANWPDRSLDPDGDGSTRPGDGLVAMVTGFREAAVVTAFWDAGLSGSPSGESIATARFFDFVFCGSDRLISEYMHELGHGHVYPLQLAVQPRLFNPTRVGNRRRKVFSLTSAIGGDPSDPITSASSRVGAAVFTDERETQATVDGLDDAVVAALKPYQIPIAPKLYQVALAPRRPTSDLALPTRLLEIAATNTPMVGGPDKTVSRFFDGSVIQVTTEEEANNVIRTLLRSEDMRTRLSHRALRAVLASATMATGVDRVLALTGIAETPPMPTLTMMVPTNRPENLANLLANLGRQTYPALDAVLVLHGIHLDPSRVHDEAAGHGIQDLEIMEVDESVILGEVFNRGFAVADGDFVGKMDDDDYYGAEYAADLMAAFSYTDADIVGKWAHYAYLEGLDAMILRYGASEYTYQPVVHIGTLIIKRDVIEAVRFPALPAGSGSVFLRKAGAVGARVYSGDRFNYLYKRSAQGAAHTWSFSEFELSARSEFVCRGLNINHVVS